MSERPRPRLVETTPLDSEAKPGNGQRALWTLLMFTLVGPFVAAVIVLALTIASGLLGVGPTSLKGLALPGLLAKAVEWSLSSYVWAALPAALAGGAMALLVLLRGTAPWLAAAAASGIAATALSALSAGVARDHISFIAFFAALSGIAVWAILRRARIIV